MESLGQKLKERREELGYSIEQAARETNITKSYLVALEVENFDDFPGETYLIGFLRNYAEYLGLSSAELITLYRSFRIQEQPVPMDELLVKRKSPRWLFPVLVTAALVVALGVFLVLYPDLIPVMETAAVVQSPVLQEPVPQARSGPRVVMDAEVLEQRFVEGTRLIILKEGVEYELLVDAVDRGVSLLKGDEQLLLALGQREELDINNSGSPDLSVSVRDIDGNAGVLRLERMTVAAVVQEVQEIRPAPAVVDTGSTRLASRVRQRSVIRSAERAEPFSLLFQFRGPSLLRYENEQGNRVETMFSKDQVHRVDANTSVRIWLSNAGNAAVRVGAQEFGFGRPGEVISAVVRWEERDGRQELAIVPVY